MKYLAYLVILLILAMTAPSLAASGTEGASFLDIPVGARPAALGSAYGPLASDVYATISNPAGLGFLRSAEASGQHLDYLESIHDEFIGAAIPIVPGKSVGFSVQYLGSGDIPSTDNSGNSIGNFSSHFAAYSFAYGQTLSDSFSLGATAKWINEKIGDFSANAYAGSMGAMYRPTNLWSFSAVADNFGHKLTFINTGDSLPLTGRLGAAYKPVSQCTLVLEGDYAQTGLAGAHTGVEWRPLESIALRAGYRTDTTKELSALAGVTAGIGISLWGQELSYAWLPMGDLGNTHYFSFLLRFNTPESERRNLIQIHPIYEHRLVQDYSLDESDTDLEDVIRLIEAPAPEVLR